jgi:hypothetical protein
MTREIDRKPMRNPNGFGTVYKLPGRRRRPWVARVTTGWTTAIAKKGKRAGQEVQRQNRQIIGCYATKQEALDALALHRVGQQPLAPIAACWSLSLHSLQFHGLSGIIVACKMFILGGLCVELEGEG